MNNGSNFSCSPCPSGSSRLKSCPIGKYNVCNGSNISFSSCPSGLLQPQSDEHDHGGQLPPGSTNIGSIDNSFHCDSREGRHESLSPAGLDCEPRDSLPSPPMGGVTTACGSTSGEIGAIRVHALAGRGASISHAQLAKGEHSASPGSIVLVRSQAQAQRCQGQTRGTRADPMVVATTHADRASHFLVPSEAVVKLFPLAGRPAALKKVDRPDKVTQQEAPSACDGFRRPLLQQSAEQLVPKGLRDRGGGGQPKRLPAAWSTPGSVLQCRG